MNSPHPVYDALSHKCTCGAQMRETRPGSGIYRCRNCDECQVGERNVHPKSCHFGPQGRVPTEADERFKRAWDRRTAHDFDKA